MPKKISFYILLSVILITIVSCLAIFDPDEFTPHELTICHDSYITTFNPTPDELRARIVGEWLINDSMSVQFFHDMKFMLYNSITNGILNAGTYEIKLDNDKAEIIINPRNAQSSIYQIHGYINICASRILHLPTKAVWLKYS